MKTIALLFILLNSKILFGQSNSYTVSTKDSADVASFWKRIVVALDKGDNKTIEINSLKIVDCLCGTDSATGDIDKWEANKFAIQLIKKYSNTKKLQNVIRTQHIKVILSPNNQGKTRNIYSVTYVLDKPNELGPKHEGTSIFFDFTKQNNTFKISSVWTIP
jgi:hypothetical protein